MAAARRAGRQPITSSSKPFLGSQQPTRDGGENSVGRGRRGELVMGEEDVGGDRNGEKKRDRDWKGVR